MNKKKIIGIIFILSSLVLLGILWGPDIFRPDRWKSDQADRKYFEECIGKYLEETKNIDFVGIIDSRGDEFVVTHDRNGIKHLFELLANEFYIIQIDGSKVKYSSYMDNLRGLSINEIDDYYLTPNWTEYYEGHHVGYKIIFFTQELKVKVKIVKDIKEIGIEFR